MALFGASFVIDLAVIFATVCFAAYAYLIRMRNAWSQKGIPNNSSHLLLGDMKDVAYRKKTMGECIKEVYSKNKDKPFVTFFAFTKPFVMINDLELAKSVLIKDFQFFVDRHIGAAPEDTLAFCNMFVAKGQFWRQLRMKLSPTFTSGKLKRMFELMDACGKGFVEHVEREKEANGDIEIKEAAARFTSDIIQSTAFGLEGDALVNEKSAFRNIMKLVFSTEISDLVKVLASFLYPSIIEKFHIVNTKTVVAKFCRETIWQTVEYREKNNVKRHDFLDLLLQLRSKGHLDKEEGDEEEPSNQENGHLEDGAADKKDFVMDGDVLVAQCFIFMVAGFETSSTTMSWTLYELALHPDIQQRAYVEIAEVLEKHGGKVTYDAIQEMTYLNMLVYETLRKYPVLPFLDRRAVQPYKLPGTEITLERGQGIFIPVMGIHHDPDIYPEPDRFDPERFSPESCQQRQPCTFLGFGEGPRICIGMRMGLLQTKVGLVYLLKNYSVSPCEKTPIPIVYDMGSIIEAPLGGIPLRLQKRSS